jgi:hypothetical protein
MQSRDGVVNVRRAPHDNAKVHHTWQGVGLAVSLGLALGVAQITWQFARKKPIETME